MNYVKIIVKRIGTVEDLQLWEDHMQEKPKCWNKFCLDIHSEDELHAVHVVKEDYPDIVYLTTLCEDCINDVAAHDVLVNEKHLMVEPKVNLK